MLPEFSNEMIQVQFIPNILHTEEHAFILTD